MDTLTIQLTNQKAYKLLQDMEELDLIKVLKKPIKLSALRKKIKTKMSNEDIDRQMEVMRNEWQRDI